MAGTRTQSEPSRHRPPSGWWRIVGDSVRLDRSQLAIGRGLRNAIGIAIPLAVAAALGEPALGVVAAGGALFVGLLDLGSAYGARWRAMLIGIAGIAVSTFVGTTTGGSDAAAVLLMFVWGLGAGLMVAVSAQASFVGVIIALALILAADFPSDAADGLLRAVVAGAGGLLQALLALVPWPIEPLRPERRTIAAAYRGLAERAGGGEDLTVGTRLASVDAVMAEDSAGRMLASPAGDALRALRATAEELRMTISVLIAERERLARAPRLRSPSVALAPGVTPVDRVLAGAEPILHAVAASIGARRPPAIEPAWVADLEVAVDALRPAGTSGSPGVDPTAGLAPETAHRARVFQADLRAAVDAASILARAPARATIAGVRLGLPRLRSPRALAVLRSNLSLGSTAFRHAIRLATVLALAVIVYRVLPLERGYWVPLTIVFVLKPDFAGTSTRVLQRYVGTALGVALTTLVITTVEPGLGLLVALCAVCAVLLYMLFWANYALFTIAITSFIVLLETFAGSPELPTALDRLVDTLIGGALAFAAFIVWPTWQSGSVKPSLARLLRAQRGYLDAVLGAPDRPPASAPELAAIRREVLREQTNVRAAIERAMSEPHRRRTDPRLALGVLEHAEGIGYATLMLDVEESEHPGEPRPDLGAGCATFAGTLDALADAVESEQEPPPLPDVRSELDRVRAAAGPTLELRVAEAIVEHLQAIHHHLRALARVK